MTHLNMKEMKKVLKEKLRFINQNMPNLSLLKTMK